MTVHPYVAADRAAALDLINADRMPGQPVATPGMLADALTGRSCVDAGWWAELDHPETLVVTDITGATVGVISCALRPRDGHGVILWLNCQEDEVVARALLDDAADVLGPHRTLDAFQRTWPCPARHRAERPPPHGRDRSDPLRGRRRSSR